MFSTSHSIAFYSKNVVCNVTHDICMEASRVGSRIGRIHIRPHLVGSGSKNWPVSIPAFIRVGWQLTMWDNLWRWRFEALWRASYWKLYIPPLPRLRFELLFWHMAHYKCRLLTYLLTFSLLLLLLHGDCWRSVASIHWHNVGLVLLTTKPRH